VGSPILNDALHGRIASAIARALRVELRKRALAETDEDPHRHRRGSSEPNGRPSEGAPQVTRTRVGLGRPRGFDDRLRWLDGWGFDHHGCVDSELDSAGALGLEGEILPGNEGLAAPHLGAVRTWIRAERERMVIDGNGEAIEVQRVAGSRAFHTDRDGGDP